MTPKRKIARHAPKSLRASVSFPEEIYRELESLAKKRKVSVAWVVRDAAEKYVAEQVPLFSEEVRGKL